MEAPLNSMFCEHLLPVPTFTRDKSFDSSIVWPWAIAQSRC